VLERLAGAGVAEAIVNVHYLADQLEVHLQTRTEPPAIRISDERNALLDTGGGVKAALDGLGSEGFFIHNADSVWLEQSQSNLARLAAAWKPEAMDSLLLLADAKHSPGYTGHGDFHSEPDGRLRRKAGDEPAPFVFAGVSIAHPRLFADSPDGAFSLNALWDRAMARGRLFGQSLEGEWMHIGTPEALAEAERRWRNLAA